MRIRTTVIVLAAVLLAGCLSLPAEKPSIAFIGMSVGTLETDTETLEFTDRFDVNQRELMGVVAFDNVAEGTNVQATWFSPDDRTMPLGRTNIVTQSGAKIARFSFASREDWKRAPYMLKILARHGEGDNQQTASGSVRFYIGMTDEEVQLYLDAYSEWEKRDQEKREAEKAEQEYEKELQKAAHDTFRSPVAVMALKHDLTGDGRTEYVFIDTREMEEFHPSDQQGILLSAQVRQFVIVNASGATLLSGLDSDDGTVIKNAEEQIGEVFPESDSMSLTILPSATISVSVGEDVREFRWRGTRYEGE